MHYRRASISPARTAIGLATAATDSPRRSGGTSGRLCGLRAGREGRHGRVRIGGDRRARGSERARPTSTPPRLSLRGVVAGAARRACSRRSAALARARRRPAPRRSLDGDGTRGAVYPRVRAAGSVARCARAGGRRRRGCCRRGSAVAAARATGRRRGAHTRARSRIRGDGTRGGAYPRVRAAGSVASMICNVRVRARMWVV